ncbi:hypothetical protein K431DRAFT_228760 [Polychaeton citri CBS 116435]|uniref:SAP domain-containing protein n=1 Tax=Polychaeton citri CBS 116435 TaxID=1314669 RepID=A0A9P4UMA8_9PEZI|nr:hypothetical protein K431DRAFT_228760 [Polychaeton citri CBS 116435]
MSNDYGKKKNDELQTLCKERGLAHTGKKADLVKRLEEDDAVKGTQTAETAAPPAEDEIDWDDEPATSKPAADALAAGGQGEVDNPQAVPNQKVDVDPSTTNELVTEGAATTEDLKEAVTEQKEAVDFTSGLEERNFEQEMQKKIDRAEKWGTGNVEELKEELERLKKRQDKFGTMEAAPKGLNTALPEKRDRKRGRDNEHDGGIRKKRGGRSEGTRGGRPGMQQGRQGSERKEAANGTGGWMSEKDIEAAERRKARFG